MREGARSSAPSPYASLTAVEAHSVTPTLPAPAARPLAAVRRSSGRWGLIVALLALPIYYGIRDLTHGYQAGVVAGHAVVHHDLSRLGFNFAQGLSNGAIWALIAIGYTLVYGIIELINFAHGDVFMIGSMTSVGLWATLGLGLSTGPAGLIGGPRPDAHRLDARVRLAQRPDRARRLPAPASGAEVSPADHRRRLLVHPAERRAAVERRLAVRRQRPHPPGSDGVQHLRGADRPRLPAGPGGDDPARVRAWAGSSPGRAPARPCARPPRIPRRRG